MNVADARAALADRLATIAGLHVYPTAPEQPRVPCAVVYLASVAPNPTFDRGAADIAFDIQILVGVADWATAQDALDNYINIAVDGSLVDALDTDTCDTAVTAIDNYGHFMLGTVDYATVTLHLVMTVS